MKKNILIIALIVSILSMIYMFLNYYGFIRYANLRLSSPEHFLKHMNTIPKNKDRIIVVFNLNKKITRRNITFINSILDQTVRPNEISLLLSYSKNEKVPDSIKNIVSTCGYSKDYGQYNSILYPILKEPDANTKILILNPNLIYGKDFLSIMIEKSDQNPNKIVYVNAHKQSDGILVTPNNLSKDFYNNLSSKENCMSQWLLENSKEIVSADYIDILK